MADEMELMPCPFCGKPPKLLFNHQTDSGECWAVECDDCDIDRWGDYRHSTDAAQKSAIAAWNTRTPTPPAGDVVLAAGVRGILHKHGGPDATGDWLVRAANEIADYATAALAAGSGERMREAGKRLVVALDAHDPLHDVQPALEAFRAALNEQEGWILWPVYAVGRATCPMR